MEVLATLKVLDLVLLLEERDLLLLVHFLLVSELDLLDQFVSVLLPLQEVLEPVLLAEFYIFLVQLHFVLHFQPLVHVVVLFL